MVLHKKISRVPGNPSRLSQKRNRYAGTYLQRHHVDPVRLAHRAFLVHELVDRLIRWSAL